MARTFNKQNTIKQVEVKGFEKIGDSAEGTFLGTKLAKITDKDGEREATMIVLQPDNGDKFAVWGNAVLEDMIQQVEPGKYVRIRHTSIGKAKGKKQGAKLFEIDVAD